MRLDPGVYYHQGAPNFSFCRATHGRTIHGGWPVGASIVLVLVTLSRQRLKSSASWCSLGSGLSETESGAIALVSGTVISDGENNLNKR